MVYPIDIEGILFWGKKNGFLTMEEIEQISTPLDSVLHMLRHFRQVPTNWKEAMMEKGITEEVINKQLAEPGSKWNPKLETLETPEKVTQFCLAILRYALEQKRALRWIKRYNLDLCYSSHLITPKLKKQFLGSTSETIGTLGLIRLDKLPKQVMVREALRERSKESSSAIVQMVTFTPLPTDRMVVALSRKRNGEISIWTTYPGEITPRLPDTNQFPAERKYNEDFWGKHALIKERKGGAKWHKFKNSSMES